MKRTKTSLLKSALALLLCVSMLIGSTFAWFTDSVTSKGNVIQSGNLDIEMYWTDDLSSNVWYNVEDAARNTIFSYDNWEPGYTDVKYIKLVNNGSLALNYKLTLTPQGAVGKLAEVINVFFADHAVDVQSREDLSKLGAIGLLNNVLNGGATANGTLLAKDQQSPLHPSGEVIMTIAMNMITTAGNDYQNKDSGEFTITALATQASFEEDSFGSDYDNNAEYPTIITGGTVTKQVNAVDGKVPAGGVTLTGNGISAFVPGGIQMADGADALTLSVTPMEHTTSDITVVNNEILIPVDVHISGIAAGNTTPIVIDLGEVLPKYMNMGNYHLYHVENGGNSVMTLVNNEADLTQHNRFTYDPLTGAVKVAMASFSEVALVADTTNPWKGEADYDWYTNEAKDAKDFKIANADQLYAFAKIVGGMNGEDAYDFDDATVTLLADINLNGGKVIVEEKTKVFYPIGYYNNTTDKVYDRTDATVEGMENVSSNVSSFSGTFDGNGHTIANFYQNTWEMFGDYNDGYSGTPNYYKDAMGLFGYVLNGTVKNLTVDSFSSDGEFTPTGVIAAYACNSTFENIAITNCEPRVYNTGNGGIVGIGGNSDDPDTYKLTFNNITIDNTNIITALWGSYDVACGGLVGMFRGAGYVYMNNCHVAAQMNVYNDVCGNYQYYWYRYSGMLVGTNKNMKEEGGYTVPETEKFHATDCTVHFGDWNDYYYCELVANSLASYTHDHQFSRLEQIKSLDEIKSGDTWTKAGNFLLISGDTKTCYHIVNKNGTLTQHLHTDAGEETVGGKTVLKEDKQIVYLPFNQLFTGYGWGVKHVPIYDDGTPNPFSGVTILDRVIADSVVKFEKAETARDAYATGATVSIGELFKAADIADSKLSILGSNVQVTVSPVDTNVAVSGTYTANSSDWTKGTLTFSGIGEVYVTISDYYFCTPTTITLKIGEPKFATVFPNVDKYIYRVGNENAVALGSLFETDMGIGGLNVAIAMESVAGNATAEYTPNSSDWKKGTIQFSDTGYVKVTVSIDDYDYETSAELYLEVVNATNLTSAGAGTNKDYVLLQNVEYSGTYLYYRNSTLYGNGFTLDITGADHSDLKDSSDTNSNKSAYCNIWMVDSRFDNVQIKGSVYPEVGMTADSDYGNAAIRTEGNCYITNSYISNCRVPLRIQGNTTLINTVVDGGRYANIELRSGKLVLDGVTTINTVRKGSDNTTDVIGFGIVIHSEAANASISVVGDGLNQYNWVGENKHKSVLSGDSNLSSAYKLIFNANNSDTIYFDYNSDRYVNTGILCLCADMNKEVVTGLDDRYCQEVSGYDAWVLTYDNSKHQSWFNESIEETVTYEPDQYPIVPEYSGNDAQTVEFTKGETYYFDTSVLKATKHSQSLDISSVVMNGTTYNYGDKIALTDGGVYEAIYTVVDPCNYNVDGTPATINHTVSVTVTAVVKDAEILAPKFTFIDQNGNKYESTTVKVGDKTYVMPNVTAADPTTNSMSSINIGSASISGTTVYFPIATGYTVRSGSNFNRYYPLFNGINITDYTIAGDTTGTTYTTSGNYTSQVGSTGTKFIIPANGGQTNCGDYVKTSGQAGNAAGNSDSGWQGSGYSTSYGGTYLKSGNTNASSGADSNGYERIVWVEYCFNAGNGDVYYYRIGYHCNKEAAQTGCFTPDTLITLADGTQKRVDELTFADKILAWDFFTCSYVEKDIALLVNHGEALYKVANLQFSDGTMLRIIAEHGVFDYDLNKYVYFTVDNMHEYIGHRFVQYAEDGTYQVVTLTKAYETEEYTSAWSITSADSSNAFASGLLTVAPPEDFYNWIEMGGKMTYDVEQFQKDVQTYGLYTYEDFKDYVTYEQFVAWNGAYLKVAVEKGYFTFEYILELIEMYKGWMPK